MKFRIKNIKKTFSSRVFLLHLIWLQITLQRLEMHFQVKFVRLTQIKEIVEKSISLRAKNLENNQNVDKKNKRTGKIS